MQTVSNPIYLLLISLYKNTYLKTMFRNVRIKQSRTSRHVISFVQVRSPIESGRVVPFGRRQRNVVSFAESYWENARGTDVITEPVCAGRVRFVRVDPDHDVAASEDAHHRRHADGGKVQRIDGFQFHADTESRSGTVVRTDLDGIEEFLRRVVLVEYVVVHSLQIVHWCHKMMTHLQKGGVG